MTSPDTDTSPPEILRSAVLFFATMGTVFGVGMLVSTYGDDIARKWHEDFAAMKTDWKKATTPDREKQRRMFGVGWQSPDFDPASNFRDISSQLENSYGRERGYSGDFKAGGSFGDEVHEL